MALVTHAEQQVLFNNTYQSQDCKTQELLDTTGAYNVSTNPTGYGSPNYAAADVNKIILLVMQPNTDDYTTCEFDGTTDPTAVEITTAAENLPINTFVLGETTADDLGQLPDGVTDAWYIPTFEDGLMGTFTLGSTAFTSTNLTSAPHAGMTHIEVDGEVYQVQITSATEGTLDREFESADGSYLMYEGFGANIKLQAFCQGDSCLASKNGQIAMLNCNCESEQRNTFLKFKAIQQGAKDLFACEAYSNSQKAVNMVTNYCNDEDCGCN